MQEWSWYWFAYSVLRYIHIEVIMWETKVFLTIFIQWQKWHKRHEVSNGNTIPDKFLSQQTETYFQVYMQTFFASFFLISEVKLSILIWRRQPVHHRVAAFWALRWLLRSMQSCAVWKTWPSLLRFICLYCVLWSLAVFCCIGSAFR